MMIIILFAILLFALLVIWCAIDIRLKAILDEMKAANNLLNSIDSSLLYGAGK